MNCKLKRRIQEKSNLICTYHIQYVNRAPRIVKCLSYQYVLMIQPHFVRDQPILEWIYSICHDDFFQLDYVLHDRYYCNFRKRKNKKLEFRFVF